MASTARPAHAVTTGKTGRRVVTAPTGSMGASVPLGPLAPLAAPAQPGSPDRKARRAMPGRMGFPDPQEQRDRQGHRGRKVRLEPQAQRERRGQQATRARLGHPVQPAPMHPHATQCSLGNRLFCRASTASTSRTKNRAYNQPRSSQTGTSFCPRLAPIGSCTLPHLLPQTRQPSRSAATRLPPTRCGITATRSRRPWCNDRCLT